MELLIAYMVRRTEVVFVPAPRDIVDRVDRHPHTADEELSEFVNVEGRNAIEEKMESERRLAPRRDFSLFDGEWIEDDCISVVNSAGNFLDVGYDGPYSRKTFGPIEPYRDGILVAFDVGRTETLTIEVPTYTWAQLNICTVFDGIVQQFAIPAIRHKLAAENRRTPDRRFSLFDGRFEEEYRENICFVKPDGRLLGDYYFDRLDGPKKHFPRIAEGG